MHGIHVLLILSVFALYRYPTCFDAAIGTLMNDLDKADVDDLQQVLSVTVGGVKHKLLDDQATSLVMGVNHPEASIRLLAVRQLVATCKEDKVLHENRAARCHEIFDSMRMRRK